MKLLHALLEKIFPERKGHRLVREAKVEDLLKFIHPTVHLNFISLLPFKQPLVRAVIHEAKFHENEAAWSLLGSILSNYLENCPTNTVIIPIPLSKQRLKSRGYNQVEKILLCSNKSLELNTKILHRLRDTAPQTSLARTERLKNLSGAFKVNEKADIKDLHIIIIDDVATTGATLKAAAKALLPFNPASITCLSLAH